MWQICGVRMSEEGRGEATKCAQSLLAYISWHHSTVQCNTLHGRQIPFNQGNPTAAACGVCIRNTDTSHIVWLSHCSTDHIIMHYLTFLSFLFLIICHTDPFCIHFTLFWRTYEIEQEWSNRRPLHFWTKIEKNEKILTEQYLT